MICTPKRCADGELHASHGVELDGLRLEYLLYEKFYIPGTDSLKDLPDFLQNVGDTRDVPTDANIVFR
jgi:hypothetical protein